MKPSLFRALSIMLLLGGIGAPWAAWAQGSAVRDARASATLAIVPFEAEAEHTGPADELMSAVRKAISGEVDITEKGPVVMSLEDARLTLGCFDEQPTCMAQMGATFGADWLLWGKLDRQGGEWLFDVSLIEVQSAQVLQRSRLRARGEGPNGEGALTALAEQIHDLLLRQIRPEEIKITFLSNPIGARLTVDGRPRGRTPVAMRLPVGEHSATLEIDTRRVSQRFSLAHGQGPRTIEITFPPLPPEAVSVPRRGGRQGSRSGLWLGVGAGVIAVGAATASTLIGLDVLDLQSEAEDRKAAQQPFSDLESEFERKRTLANVGWAVTAVAAGTSIYFLLFHDEPTPSAAVGISPTPAGAMIHGQF